MVVEIRAVVGPYAPNVYFEPTVWLLVSSKFLDLWLTQILKITLGDPLDVLLFSVMSLSKINEIILKRPHLTSFHLNDLRYLHLQISRNNVLF